MAFLYTRTYTHTNIHTEETYERPCQVDIISGGIACVAYMKVKWLLPEGRYVMGWQKSRHRS